MQKEEQRARPELIYFSTRNGLQTFTCSTRFSLFQFPRILLSHLCHADSAERDFVEGTFVLFSSHFSCLTIRQRNSTSVFLCVCFLFFLPPPPPTNLYSIKINLAFVCKPKCHYTVNSQYVLQNIKKQS